jgi:hypothetical protein
MSNNFTIVIDQNAELYSQNGIAHVRAKDSPPIPPTPNPTPIIPVVATVAVQNLSTNVSDADVQTWTAALKKQIDLHAYPTWGKSVDFVFVPKGITPPVADWYAAFINKSDSAGALAYHDVGPNGEPLSKIFTEDEIAAGESPSVGYSHELLECISDTDANTTVQGLDEQGKAVLFFLENCDPVESNTYQIDGVDLSNFVFPNWFNKLPKQNSFDQLGIVTKQFQIAPGGYSEESYDNGQTWVTVQKQSKRALIHNNSHRHKMYKTPKDQRKKSEFQVNKDWDVRVRQ